MRVPVITLKKVRTSVSVLGVCAVLTGCAGSILSGAGPSIRSLTSEDARSSYDLIDLSATTISPYMRAVETSPVNTVASKKVFDVKLMAGDVVKILIADDSGAENSIFAPLSMGGTTFSSVRLDSSGFISLPYVGRKALRGATLSEAELLIKDSLKGKAGEPQVHIELIGDVSGSVLVAGAVKSPGRFSALQGPLTLLDAINQAGGPVLEPHLIRVVVRTGDSVEVLNYEDVLAGRNQTVSPNSEIILERARKRFVAMGAISAPGLHDLPSNNPSLLEVLGVAGGLKESASDASGVFIFRLNDLDVSHPDKKPSAEVFRLNMKDPAAIFIARQFLVHPEDAVYVTNAAVYEWQKIISPIVQVLLLGRTIQNGF